MTKELLEQLNSYVEENLRFRLTQKIVLEAFACRVAPSRLREKRLEETLAAADKETFAEYLLRYMDERGAAPVDVYKRAQLDRRFLSKLRTNRKYKPHKRTLIAVAFGLELSIDEATDLLARAGYSFSDYDKADVIAKFFFEQNIHDLFTVNEALDRYGCKTLGG